MTNTVQRAIVYFGTPDEAVPPLEALHASGHNVVLVITRADARRGRRGAAAPSPVKEAAVALGIPVSHTLDDVIGSGATLGIVVAYGRIIPADILDQVPMINIHFSKLPRWRGAAPVERAVLAGDTETAVGIMAMEAGLDTGPLYAETIVPIQLQDSVEDLRAQLVVAGTSLLLETLNNGLDAEPSVQQGEPLYASKITTADRKIDWAMGSEEINRRVRVGRAHTTLRGDRFIIWEAEPLGEATSGVPGTLSAEGSVPVASTVDGGLRLIEVQPAGKPRMTANSWWNGAQPTGVVLGS